MVRLERALAGALEVDLLGQQHWQVRFGDRDDPVGRAVDDRDGRAPVALPTDQPVANPVADGGSGDALRGQVRHDRADGVRDGQAVVSAGVHQTIRRGLAHVGGRKR